MPAMQKLRFLLVLIGSAAIVGGVGGCSSNSNTGLASVGGTDGTNPGVGGALNQGGQSAGGTGQATHVNEGPPCTPVAVANSLEPATIATASYDMQSVTVSGADVYYLDHGKGVYRLTGGVGTPTQVVPPVTDTSVGHTMVGGVLQIDSTHVYFAQDESLYRSALANPSPELLVTAANDITQVEIDDSYVYYVVTTGTIGRIPLAGGTPEELVPAEASAQSMQLVNGTMYFVNFDLGEVGRLPAGGGTIEYLTPYDDASEVVVVSDTTLFFSDWSSLYAAPRSNPKQLTLLGSGGGDMMTNSSFERVKLVGDRLYWFDSGDHVGWTKTDGSQCGLLFSAEMPNWVTDIAVASDAIYVALKTTLLKLPR